MIKDWIAAIRTVVKEEIKFLQQYENNSVNSMKSWSGIVDTVNSINNTATVILAGESIATSYIQNKTGQNLINGDEVFLFSMSGKLGDAFIMVAKKQYINN